MVDLWSIAIGTELGRGTYPVKLEDVVRFAALFSDGEAERHGRKGTVAMGTDSNVALPGMIFLYSLRLGWDLTLFPPGAIRMGDNNCFLSPARAGDVLTTSLTVSERFERKGRRFVTFLCVTENDRRQKICTVEFTALLPLVASRVVRDSTKPA